MTTTLSRFCPVLAKFRQIRICKYTVSSEPLYVNVLRNYSSISYTFPQVIPCQYVVLRKYSDTGKPADETKSAADSQKLTLLQRFKQMYRDYWYVLVPVHIVTSAAWFGSFYYLAKSGVDVASLLQTLHVSETIINRLRDSSMGYVAVSYALYKLASPLRYTVTIGGTTVSINYLKKWGYIKPVPSREKLKELYKEKRGTIMESIRAKKDADRKGALIAAIDDPKVKIKLSQAQDGKQHRVKTKREPIIEQFEKGLEDIKRGHDTTEYVKVSKKQR